MKYTRMIFAVAFGVLCSMALGSCKHDDEPETADVESLTIVYAINNSSLSSDFESDCKEMLVAMDGIDAERNKLMVYRMDNNTTCALYEPEFKKGVWGWRKICDYNRQTTSTDPAVLERVLRDACSRYPDVHRTLIFWGHGSAWTPEFTDHQPTKSAPQRAFGGEYGSRGLKWMELTDLCQAIPEKFDVIWFDCCYMSAIEVAYQIRGKADWLVAYPSEVWSKGLNYDDILPYIMRKDPGLVDAAKSFYEYYAWKDAPATVAVMDLSKIEPVADAMKRIFGEYPVPPQTYDIANYRRFDTPGYYDMRQLADRRTGSNAALMSSFDNAMNNFVIYQACSSRDFNKNKWPDPNLSAVSMNNFKDSGSKEDEYYKTLDWYMRTAY
ncbi:MAG: clostripain-related cysteine peptidase [Bacteroidales bacterium]|nr:clostripain-related cysteine peptidase [Bacteroidales bacterium]